MTEIKKQKITGERSAWPSGMMDDNKRERTYTLKSMDLPAFEKLSQRREKVWGKFADVDLLKKRKAEGTTTEKTKTEENAELKTSSKLIFTRTALAFHFYFSECQPCLLVLNFNYCHEATSFVGDNYLEKTLCLLYCVNANSAR